jgi:hypothetical protein
MMISSLSSGFTVSTTIVPPAGVNLIALLSRLTNTCFSRAGSPITCARVASKFIAGTIFFSAEAGRVIFTVSRRS